MKSLPRFLHIASATFGSKRHQTESTIPLAEVAHGHGSPGQIFKLPEEDIRLRAECLQRQTDGLFSYGESANLQQIRRHGEVASLTCSRGFTRRS